jgi:hypothetical protein
MVRWGFNRKDREEKKDGGRNKKVLLYYRENRKE